jgi:hypothetical protein
MVIILVPIVLSLGLAANTLARERNAEKHHARILRLRQPLKLPLQAVKNQTPQEQKAPELETSKRLKLHQSYHSIMLKINDRPRLTRVAHMLPELPIIKLQSPKESKIWTI